MVYVMCACVMWTVIPHVLVVYLVATKTDFVHLFYFAESIVNLNSYLNF